ncbi:FecR family protein [Butyricimonas synergistica]|uniref:FecR family protein n=1 Tax=Butyricimonas synergistica TaxID=544644 RepID=UPI00037EAB32|nr:FecR family protein [Butyricimonas synergistica]
MKNKEEIYQYEIAALILAYLRNEIDDEGRKKLDSWLSESASHEVLLARVRDEELQMEAIRKILSYDANKAWMEVTRKVARRRRRRVGIIYRIAASVVVVLGVSLALWMNRNEKVNTNKVVEVAQVAEIVPGRPMATLTVASGAVYQLDTLNNVALSSALAANNGKEVIFTDLQGRDSLVEVQYNKIEIPRGGEYKITLSDGTHVYLNSQTVLRFPESFANSEQRVVYLSGEAYFEVAKNATKPFIVCCKNYNVKVLGTSFNVNDYEDESDSKTTLASGKVEISMNGRQTVLKPGQQAVIKAGWVDVKEVDVEVYTTWMHENFRFQSETVEEIMKKLARWYNIDVVYLGESVKGYHFTGYLPRYADISKVLDLLSLTTKIKFELKGKTIMVMER